MGPRTICEVHNKQKWRRGLETLQSGYYARQKHHQRIGGQTVIYQQSLRSSAVRDPINSNNHVYVTFNI